MRCDAVVFMFEGTRLTYHYTRKARITGAKVPTAGNSLRSLGLGLKTFG